MKFTLEDNIRTLEERRPTLKKVLNLWLDCIGINICVIFLCVLASILLSPYSLIVYNCIAIILIYLGSNMMGCFLAVYLGAGKYGKWYKILKDIEVKEEVIDGNIRRVNGNIEIHYSDETLYEITNITESTLEVGD